MKNMNINIFLFDKFETLDIFGPIEILARNKNHQLFYYSLNGGIVTSAQGTKVYTESIKSANKKGVLVVPGGQGTRELVNDDKFLNTLKSIAIESEYCLSICTGSALFAKAGLLNGRRATSNKLAFQWVKATSDKTIWVEKARWVVDGKYYTSSGVSAGMDMSLGFIEDLYGTVEAENIAKNIEYIWNRNKEEDLFYKEELSI